MARRRPLTKKVLEEIAEAARRGPGGKPFDATMRDTIKGTATPPEPQPPPQDPAANG